MKPILWMFAVVGISSALIVFVVGCGHERDVPTSLEADPKTGEVTLKGDKGDQGEKGQKGDPGERGAQGEAGPQGPKGDQGAEGKPGKDAPESLPVGIWRDPMTGKQWFTLHYKTTWPAAGTACAPYVLPTIAVLTTALQHGLVKNLPVNNASGTERAWTNQPDPSGPTDGYYRTLTVMDPTNDVFGAAAGYLGASSNYRVYCVKE